MTELATSTAGKAEVDALLERHGLAHRAAAVAFFSFAGPQSFIGARDSDGSITPLIGFAPLPVRGAELLEAIAATDENGQRLVANYERTFPELVAEIRAFGSELDAVETESLGWLLAASSVVLGMSQEDVDRALAAVPELVLVDTHVVEHDGRYLLDGRRLLRSVMSYRIAGVPNHVLARSVFESLGEYAATAIRRLLRDWKVEVVACAGDLFARNAFLADPARRGLVSPRFRAYFPEPAEAASCA